LSFKKKCTSKCLLSLVVLISSVAKKKVLWKNGTCQRLHCRYILNQQIKINSHSFEFFKNYLQMKIPATTCQLGQCWVQVKVNITRFAVLSKEDEDAQGLFFLQCLFVSMYDLFGLSVKGGWKCLLQQTHPENCCSA